MEATKDDLERLTGRWESGVGSTRFGICCRCCCCSSLSLSFGLDGAPLEWTRVRWSVWAFRPKYSHSPSCDAAVLAQIAVAASSPSYTSAWQLLFDFAHRHRHPIHHEKLAKKLMLRGNTRSVQGKLSDWIALELGSGMSNLRIGDRNARSHAPSAGAAQPAHSPLAHCISSPHLLHPCASPLPQPNHLGPIPTPFDRHPLVHSSTRPLPRLASHRIAIRLDCIRPLPLLHYGEIPAQPATTQQCHDFDV